MKKTLLASVLPALFVGGVAFAQDDEPQTYTYATYMYCDTDGQERADEIVAEYDKPVLDKLVEDGEISGWGWLAHHTGGKWRRIRYHQSDSLEGALDGLDAMNVAMEKAMDDDVAEEFADICDAHDDYIWQNVAGTGGDERGTAGFSVYHMCDINRESRADEIVTETFGPVYDKLVEDGKLTSWGWSTHVVGGKIRKLQTMTGSDHKAVLAARAEAIAMTYDEGNNAAGTEFSEICGSHVDYMWNIVHEKTSQ